MLINLGVKKLSLVLFKNLALVHSITFPVGIDHISNDISKVCSLNFAESLALRDNINFLFEDKQDSFDENDFLKKNFFVSTKFRKISKDLILNVIKARSDEIFEMFKNQLKVNGFNFNSGINIFLTGEGSNLKNVEKYCQEFFGLNSAVKKKEKLEKIFPACFGGIRIIKDGWETEAIPEVKDKGIEKIGFLRKLFGNH